MRHKAGDLCVFTGILLILAASALYAFNRWDNTRAGLSVIGILDRFEDAQEDYMKSIAHSFHPEQSGFEKHEDAVMPVVVIDDYEYIGTLCVPDYGLCLPVMSEWSYPGLKLAPGRYAGSVWNDDLVICGHNYERHFGNLRYLKEGDIVTFTDVPGNEFIYEVALVQTLKPTAVDEMTAGEWDLTMFTCTVGGRARVAVRCERIR